MTEPNVSTASARRWAAAAVAVLVAALPAAGATGVRVAVDGPVVNAELDVVATSVPPAARAGQVLTATYVVANHGPGLADGLAASLTLPLNTSFVSASASADAIIVLEYGAAVARWTRPLAAGGHHTFTVVLRVDDTAQPGDRVVLGVGAQSLADDFYGANNQAGAVIFVAGPEPGVDLALSGVASAGGQAGRSIGVRVGETASIRVTVTNHGAAPAAGLYAIWVDDGSRLIVDRVGLSQGSILSPSQNSGDWDTAAIAPGATASVELDLRVVTTQAAALRVVRVNGSPADPDARNDALTIVIDGIGDAPRSGRDVAIGHIDGASGGDIVVAAGEGEAPELGLANGRGQTIAGPYFAFDRRFLGGVRVTSCDVDGDGIDEIVAAQGPGGGQVRVIAYAAGIFTPVAAFTPFETGFAGGVYVACADLDGNGRGELVVGAGPGRRADVRVYTVGSGVVTQTAAFQAYEAAFTGGVRVSAARVPGGVLPPLQVLTSPGAGRLAEVKAWRISGSGAALVAAATLGTASGVTTAIGDADGDGQLDVAFIPDDGAPYQ
ncbi:MAG: VCBS repeat-containing protein, partial [Acidobacteria bacterium]|nr:VCBS repeat-containing protein [Acidobacteriota bacterium]